MTKSRSITAGKNMQAVEKRPGDKLVAVSEDRDRETNEGDTRPEGAKQTETPLATTPVTPVETIEAATGPAAAISLAAVRTEEAVSNSATIKKVIGPTAATDVNDRPVMIAGSDPIT
jgi:hypothetical protein